MAYEPEKTTPKTLPRRPSEERALNDTGRSSGVGTGVVVALGVAAVIVLGLVFVDWDGDDGETGVIRDDPAAVVVDPSVDGETGATAPVAETAPEPAPTGNAGAPAAEESAPAADGSATETAPAADR